MKEILLAEWEHILHLRKEAALHNLAAGEEVIQEHLQDLPSISG